MSKTSQAEELNVTKDRDGIIYLPEEIERLSVPEILAIPSRVLMKQGKDENKEEYKIRSREISNIIKGKLASGQISVLEHDKFIKQFSEKKHIIYDIELVRRVVCGDKKAIDYLINEFIIECRYYDKLSKRAKFPSEKLCENNFMVLNQYTGKNGGHLKAYFDKIFERWYFADNKIRHESPIDEITYQVLTDSSAIESDEFIDVKGGKIDKTDYLTTMDDVFHAYSLLSQHEIEILKQDVFYKIPQMEILDLINKLGADWNSANTVSGKKFRAKEALLKQTKWVQLYRIILGDQYPFKSFYQVCREKPELDKRIEVKKHVWEYDMRCIHDIILIMAEDFKSNRVAFLEEIYKQKVAEESRHFCKFCGKAISPSIQDGRTIYACKKCGHASEDCILGTVNCIFCGSKKIKEANVGNHKVLVCKKCMKSWRKLPPVTTILNFFFDKENNKEKFPQNFQFYDKDIKCAFSMIKDWIVPTFNEGPIKYWDFNQKRAKLNKIRDRAINGLKNRYCWELLLERVMKDCEELQDPTMINMDAANQFHARKIFHLKKAWQDLDTTDQKVLKTVFFEGGNQEWRDSQELAITNLRAIYLDRLNSDSKN